MAISWDLKISDVNTVSQRGTVAFTRTDSEKPDATESYIFNNAQLAAEYRAPLLDTVWAKHLEHTTKAAAIATFVSNLEQLGKANLEAREV